MKRKKGNRVVVPDAANGVMPENQTIHEREIPPEGGARALALLRYDVADVLQFAPSGDSSLVVSLSISGLLQQIFKIIRC